MAEIPPHPSVALLHVLVGEWEVEFDNPLEPGARLRARASFAWMAGGRFLIQDEPADPPFPSGHSLFGRERPDDAESPLLMHYFDSRGVARTYRVALRDRVWTIWRDGPGFAQRFRGTFSADGATITGSWERSDDGWSWEHDFNLTYRRARRDGALGER